MGDEPSLRGLQTGRWPKLGSYGKYRIFGPKPEIRAKKKEFTSKGATTGKSWKIRVFLFYAFIYFSTERKNGRFSINPARTGSVVILGHLLMARTVPPSFVENGKLRVLIPMKWHNPKRPKTGVSSEKWPYLGNFFGGGPNGKIVAPGILVICPVGKDCNYHTKNWLLAPNIQILGSKLHIFVPSSQFEPHWSRSSTRKRCLIGSLLWDTKSFTPSPQKMDFWPKNGQICPKTGIFGQTWAFLAHLTQCPTEKQFEQVAKVVFQLCGYKNFYLLP